MILRRANNYFKKYTKLYKTIYQKYSNKYTKIYTKMYPRYIQNTQDIHKIPSGSRTGPSPAQARGRARAGPGPRDPGLVPGLCRVGCRLVFCVFLGYLGYILDISWYMFWYIFRLILEAEYVGSAALFRTLTYTPHK